MSVVNEPRLAVKYKSISCDILSPGTFRLQSLVCCENCLSLSCVVGFASVTCA